MRLKLSGEIQPFFNDYWNQQVLPNLDGIHIDYIGEADFAIKNDLLSKARALLFPIQWEEPFGLVMIEAMACGTPVLAFRGGAVEEIVRDGVNGWICTDEADMAAARRPSHLADACRAYVAEHFGVIEWPTNTIRRLSTPHRSSSPQSIRRSQATPLAGRRLADSLPHT